MKNDHQNQYIYNAAGSQPEKTALKLLCLFFITVMTLFCSNPALAATAEEYNGPTTYDWITVQHYVPGETTDGWFLVTIPDRLSFGEKTTLECPLSWAMIPETWSVLWAYVKSQNERSLIDSGTNSEIPYDIYMPDNPYHSYASEQEGSYHMSSRHGYLIGYDWNHTGEYSEGGQSIHFVLNEEVAATALPGNYIDTLTFFFGFGGIPEPV